jgi:hypothetical protein
MKALLAILFAGTAAFAATLGTSLSFGMQTDSLGFSPARRLVTLESRLDAGPVEFSLRDRYLDSDSGGIVQRFYEGRNDLLARATVTAGFVRLSPGIRWNVETRQGPDMVLPASAGTARNRGFIEPFFGLGASLPWGFGAEVRGWMNKRDLEVTPYGTLPEWKTNTLSGSLSWTCPRRITTFTIGAATSRTQADGILYESGWDRGDFSVSMGTPSYPARTQVLGEVRVSAWNGDNYLYNDLGTRVQCRLRAVRWLTPNLSVNVTGQTSFDERDEGWTYAASAGGARLVWTTSKTELVPTSVMIGGRYTTSSIITSRLEALSRIHLVAGLAGVLSADFWTGPSVTPGGFSTRRKVVLGTGLEYRFSRDAILWARIESERSEFGQTSDWSRISAGAEFLPPLMSF